MRLPFTTFLRAHVFPISLFVVLRVWTMLWASIGAALIPLSAEASKHYYGMEPLHDWVFAPWQRWDTIWYTKIAWEGYAADASSHFPPLYPLLIRLFTPLTGNNAVAAGLGISSVAALASFILLYQLALSMFDQAAARRTLLFLGAFPTTFFLFAAYTESLFLAFALGAFLCAGRKHWVWAGVLGALAAMTRPQGMVFFLPLAVEFWMQYRQGDVHLAHAWSLLLVLAGGAAHILWLAFQFGTLTAWFRTEAIMHRVVPPWEALAQGWGAVFRATSIFEAGLSFLDPFAVLVLLAALIWSARRLPLSLSAYLAIILAPSLFVVTTYSEAYPLTSVSRFTVLAFPLFLLLGTLPPRRWETWLLAGSFLLQTLLLVLFAAWVFVRCGAPRQAVARRSNSECQMDRTYDE
jgi:hypothetical protein